MSFCCDLELNLPRKGAKAQRNGEIVLTIQICRVCFLCAFGVSTQHIVGTLVAAPTRAQGLLR